MERLGALDSLHYSEISSLPLPLAEDWLEVDIAASGVNFKDVAITMGIVAGDEHSLGGEGAGIVTRVGANVHSFRPGDRVVVMFPGTLANKVQVPYHCAHLIADSMSFEEAASLPIAYLTSLHALFDLANLKKGQRVLIHSATGGVGNAAVQLCQYMDAEVFLPL